jgi:hypothetical protein
VSQHAVAEVREQFWKPDEGERPPLKVGTRGVVKRQQTEKTKCVL